MVFGRGHKPKDASVGKVMGRRAILRTAGGVVALVGSAAAVQVASPGTAEAASGDPLLVGPNDAGAVGTTLTASSATNATLKLLSTSDVHAPLSLGLATNAFLAQPNKWPGEFFTDALNQLFYVDSFNPVGSLVFSESNCNQVVSIAPVRALDTRSERSNVLNPQVLDTAHRLRGGQWLQLDLTSLALYFESAFVNLTAVSPTGAGYLTIAPEPPAGLGAPPTSSLNYAKAVNLANSAVAGTVDGTVWIYTTTTCHVVLDVTAVNLPTFDYLLVPTAGALQDHARRKAAFAQAHQARHART